MAQVNIHLDWDKRVTTFAQQRISELKDQLRNGKAEVEFWEEMLHRLKMCVSCGGKGAIGVFIAQDEKTSEPCAPCGGTGFRK